MTEIQLSLPQVRQMVDGTWDEVARWFSAKPGIFTLPHPEQQVMFEYADRLRRTFRHAISNHTWDRLYFDASALTLETAPLPFAVGRRPPLYIDTRQLLGIPTGAPRDPGAPDIAVSLQVIRSAPETLELDDDARPRRQNWTPLNVRVQGWYLEEHVRQLEELSLAACEGFLFVIYSNEARRKSAVDLREVASWASWQQPSETLWWAARRFRARPRTQA
jgi:hypothetical protein